MHKVGAGFVGCLQQRRNDAVLPRGYGGGSYANLSFQVQDIPPRGEQKRGPVSTRWSF